MIPTLYRLSTGKELSDDQKKALIQYSNFLQSIRLDHIARNNTVGMSGGIYSLDNITLAGSPYKKEGTHK